MDNLSFSLLVLLKVAVLVFAAMVYGLCMFGCTCTCMLARFLQLKPLMKTSFTIAALLVSYLITYEITCDDFIGSICYLNVNLMVCDRAALTACYWTKCGGSSFIKTLDFMCNNECEEGYYSFPGQELWRYFKEKGRNIKIVSVCYLCLCVYL